MRRFGLLFTIIISPWFEAVAEDGLPGPGPVLTKYGQRLEERNGLREPQQRHPHPVRRAERPTLQPWPQEGQQTPGLLPGRPGGAVGARGRLLGEESTPARRRLTTTPQEPPPQKTPEQKRQERQERGDRFTAILEEIDRRRRQISAARDELAQNALVQEVRLVKLLRDVLGDPAKLGRDLRAWLAGDESALDDLPPALVEKTLVGLQRAIKKLRDRTKGRKGRNALTRLHNKLNRIRKQAAAGREVVKEVKAEIETAADLLSDLSPEALGKKLGELVVDEVKGEIVDAIKTKAKNMLVRQLGAKAAGGLLSIASDLSSFFDALGTINDIEDLRAAYDDLTLRMIREGAEVGLGQPTGGVTRSINAHFPKTLERLKELGVKRVRVTPRVVTWDPDAEDGPTFVTRSLPTRTFSIDELVKHEQSKAGIARTPDFDLEIPATNTPGYVVVDVDGGAGGAGNILYGVLNPPSSAGGR